MIVATSYAFAPSLTIAMAKADAEAAPAACES